MPPTLVASYAHARWPARLSSALFASLHGRLAARHSRRPFRIAPRMLAARHFAPPPFLHRPSMCAAPHSPRPPFLHRPRMRAAAHSPRLPFVHRPSMPGVAFTPPAVRAPRDDVCVCGVHGGPSAAYGAGRFSEFRDDLIRAARRFHIAPWMVGRSCRRPLFHRTAIADAAGAPPRRPAFSYRPLRCRWSGTPLYQP
jgi:hypothetical protein